MKFDECVVKYPIQHTLVGYYDSDQYFRLPIGGNVDDIEHWQNPPFQDGEGCYSFITYDPFIRDFTCWQFIFQRVEGYINNSNDPNNFFPAICSKDFNWEKIDPYAKSGFRIIPLSRELAEKFGWPLDEYATDKYRKEQIAYLFNPKSYLEELTFTNAAAIKKFVNEQKALSN